MEAPASLRYSSRGPAILHIEKKIVHGASGFSRPSIVTQGLYNNENETNL